MATFTSLGFQVRFDETDLFDTKYTYDKNGEVSAEVKPFFVPTWNRDTNEWNFRSKKTGKFYTYDQVVKPDEAYRLKLEKAKKYETFPVFFSHWAKMALYYNSFEPYQVAFDAYTGKPKGRDTFAEDETEKWFKSFKEKF